MRSSQNVDDADHGYSDPPFLVLASLAEGPKHGHAMLNDIEAMCGRRLGPGTLYGAIGRLERQGLIEPLPVDDRRRPYRLTRAGQALFASRLETMRRIVDAGEARLARS
ncbi:MAG: PadR family transcriptional regulator [Asticcacaulis sp.]